MKKVLVITQDPIKSAEIRRQLQFAGIQVGIVCESSKIFSYLNFTKYNLLIIDYGDAGLKLLSDLRSKGNDIPAILLTNNLTIELLSEAFNIGFDDVITKPIKLLELELRVVRLFKRTPITNYDRLKYHDLEVDFENKSINRSGSPLKLSNKEIELLRYLVLNRNRLVSREKLLANIWNDRPSIKTNTVDCYMSSLRKKIDSKGEHKFLQTRHGMGYVFHV